MAENESIMYAADNGADVVNLSSNGYWTRTLVPECGRPGIYNLEKFGTNKNLYDELIVELEAELEMIEEVLIGY